MKVRLVFPTPDGGERYEYRAVSGSDEMIALLEWGAAWNADYLRARPRLPHPYRWGSIYLPEPPPREDWQLGDVTMRRGEADCEDWAMLLSGWYRGRNIDPWAHPVLSYHDRSDGSRLWHVMVERADGSIEDPSRVMGMGRNHR